MNQFVDDDKKTSTDVAEKRVRWTFAENDFEISEEAAKTIVAVLSDYGLVTQTEEPEGIKETLNRWSALAGIIKESKDV